VTNLARETAEATERIRDVVGSVQSDTETAMGSIDRIRGVITQVVDAQTTIAAAVEEQTSATTQARHAIDSAAGEADRMAADLRAVAAL
jgi:methyl-accepting chemotaxis protein